MERYFKLSQENLTNLLDEASIRYYNGLDTKFSDIEFDLLFKRLQEMEKCSGIIYPNSPTIRVGSDLQDGFKKVAHPKPMFTIENTYDDNGLIKWVDDMKLKHDAIEYNVSIKYDGVSCELWYENGKLVKAVTRGDKNIGDDITENVKTIKNIPLVLRGLNDVEKNHIIYVRGEILMPKSKLKEINDQRIKEGLEPFANTRNACSGSIKQLDPKVTASRGLIFKAWDMFYGDDFPVKLLTMDQKFYILEDYGFHYEPGTEPFSVYDFMLNEQVNEFKNKIDTLNLDYDYDGVVIKVNSVAIQDNVGTKDTRALEWAIARKWNEDRMVETTLLGVDWQVGRTGVLTPVGRLEPVICDGVEISNVTLHNWDFIQSKELKRFSRVKITRSGGVIPYVVSVKNDDNLRMDFAYPSYCPICGGKTEMLTDALISCTNDKCPSKIEGKIMYFCSKDCMDIRGVGESVVKRLVEVGLVETVVGLYNLDRYTVDELVNILGEGYGRKSVSKMLEAIEESKKKPFENVLAGLSIPNVGKVMSRILCKTFKNIDNLFNAKFYELINIDGIGDIMAFDIINWFNEPDNIVLCSSLMNLGLSMAIEETEEVKQIEDRNIKVCFTGKSFKFKGDEVEDYLKNNGFTITGVSKSLDYLIIGEKPGGSKVKKAEDYGIKIISEVEFYEMFNI